MTSYTICYCTFMHVALFNVSYKSCNKFLAEGCKDVTSEKFRCNRVYSDWRHNILQYCRFLKRVINGRWHWFGFSDRFSLWSLGHHRRHIEMHYIGCAKIKINGTRTDVITHQLPSLLYPTILNCFHLVSNVCFCSILEHFTVLLVKFKWFFNDCSE